MFKGKIVLVPFPFDDLSTTKVRPAVCLTNPIGVYQHVVLAFISSRTTMDLLETDFVLEPSQNGFATTGLKTVSTLRLHRLMTLTTSMFQRELGELTPQMISEIDDRLRKLFVLG